jgi:hypothetical protein
MKNSRCIRWKIYAIGMGEIRYEYGRNATLDI